MKKTVISALLGEVADTILNPPKPREVRISHKKIVKKSITHKQPKPGKNKPAKGYNSKTKEWNK